MPRYALRFLLAFRHEAALIVMKLLLAAPAKGLQSLPIALLSQDCAITESAANTVIRAARMKCFIVASSVSGDTNATENGLHHHGRAQTLRDAIAADVAKRAGAP